MKLVVQDRYGQPLVVDGHRFLGDVIVENDKGKPVAVLCLWLDTDLNIVITGEGRDRATLISCHGEPGVAFEPSAAWKARLQEAAQ